MNKDNNYLHIEASFKDANGDFLKGIMKCEIKVPVVNPTIPRQYDLSDIYQFLVGCMFQLVAVRYKPHLFLEEEAIEQLESYRSTDEVEKRYAEILSRCKE